MQPAEMVKLADANVRLEGLWPRLPIVLVGVGAVAMVVALALGSLEYDYFRYFFHAYLTSFAFYLSLSLGSLFLVAMLHVTRAGWGVVVRRLAEVFGANVLLLGLLFLPLLVPMLLGLVPGLSGYSGLYSWVDPDAASHNALLAKKQGYLNPGFFAVRAIGYFIVWGLIARYFLTRSTEQDTSADPVLTIRMERLSGPGLLLLGITVTLASFDWLMSLKPEWYSTIFGLYYYSGGVVGAVAAIILAAMLLQSTGRLTTAITTEHYHDLGKILLAAVIFWGYMAFSQYLLIWYANIPEETQWYQTRFAGFWGPVAVVLLFGHLLIPFMGLLSRWPKRNKWLLAFWALWLLVVHWIDVYWLVMPNLGSEYLPLGPINLCLTVGLGCFFLAGVWWLALGRALVPLRDPRLAESLAFENA